MRTMVDKDALSVMIQQELARRDLSIRDGARLCNISFANLSAIIYQRSRRPSPELLDNIATGLGLPYEDLALAAYGIVPRRRGPVPA